MRSVLYSHFLCVKERGRKNLFIALLTEAKKKVSLLLVVQVFSRLKTRSRLQGSL